MKVTKTMFQRLKSRTQSLRDDSEGSASIEFVLWMPVFMLFLMLIVDASFLFMNQSNYWSISRDTARLVARHAITEEQAAAYAQNAAVTNQATPTTNVTVSGQTVTIELSSPAASLTVFNVFSFATPFTVVASTTQALEPI